MPTCRTISWNASPSLRFLIVGGWNFSFGYGAFALLWHLLAGTWPDWVISAFATILGITMSFATHRRITYRSKGCWWKEYIRFYAVYGAQSLLNIALICLFVTHMKLNAYAVQFVITVSLTAASYWAHRHYSFKESAIQ